MKKRFVLFTVILILTLSMLACGGSDLTLEDIAKAYEDSGVTVDLEEKPLYDMIEAIDGVIFYIDNWPVKVYEFESKKALKESEIEFEYTIDKFGLEDASGNGTSIFKSLE